MTLDPNQKPRFMKQMKPKTQIYETKMKRRKKTKPPPPTPLLPPPLVKILL